MACEGRQGVATSVRRVRYIHPLPRASRRHRRRPVLQLTLRIGPWFSPSLDDCGYRRAVAGPQWVVGLRARPHTRCILGKSHRSAPKVDVVLAIGVRAGGGRRRLTTMLVDGAASFARSLTRRFAVPSPRLAVSLPGHPRRDGILFRVVRREAAEEREGSRRGGRRSRGAGADGGEPVGSIHKGPEGGCYTGGGRNNKEEFGQNKFG